MGYDLSTFRSELSKYDLKMDVKQEQQFIRYYELLISWNEKINLTAITDFEDVLIKHFADSASIASMDCFRSAYEKEGSLSLIDVGTGAGFPGIPIKILFPGVRLTLLDSLQKRVNFLNEVVSELGLSDVNTVHGRAEDFGKDPAYREQYDFVVSRAVANLAVLSELCTPFCKVGGSFISYKGDHGAEELADANRALSLLGCEVRSQIDFKLSDEEFHRFLFDIHKVKATDRKYPRPAGTPQKKPLV
ncbi:MAG: 16S rRNA (guanine(527)-N(7))-methyltransferase RsmG [Lachnospiraceae bacterium]|nr:16S rRNA (guanine(527)-N(7))-methyltransferase RsmG [Lachnospiraceae bacterium]